MSFTYYNYLESQAELIDLYGSEQMYLEIADSYMPAENWQDEMYLDEIFADKLPYIRERIDLLVQLCKSFKKTLTQSIYQEYIKRRMHPDRVNQIMIEKNLDFNTIYVEEDLFN